MCPFIWTVLLNWNWSYSTPVEIHRRHSSVKYGMQKMVLWHFSLKMLHNVTVFPGKIGLEKVRQIMDNYPTEKFENLVPLFERFDQENRGYIDVKRMNSLITKVYNIMVLNLKFWFINAATFRLIPLLLKRNLNQFLAMTWKPQMGNSITKKWAEIHIILIYHINLMNNSVLQNYSKDHRSV